MEIVDPHHHFIDDSNDFQSFLCSLGCRNYSPDNYADDSKSLKIRATVHVEALPDDGLKEAKWVQSIAQMQSCRVPIAGIVAQCNLADVDAESQLDALQTTCPLLRGIRYILDYDGPFDPQDINCPTHVACSRHGLDYLRDPIPASAFERGFAMLAQRGLSFDLQCAPVQLPAAAALLARHPTVRVCIDHMGKPRHLKTCAGEDNNSSTVGSTLTDNNTAAADIWSTSALKSPDQQLPLVSSSTAAKIIEWRSGMAAMAKLPQVYVKLSMLGYAVPGWHNDLQQEALLRALLLETIERFGAARFMFSSNFHVNGAVSDSDGLLTDGPTFSQLYEKFYEFVAHLPLLDQQRLFAGTASEFYRV